MKLAPHITRLAPALLAALLLPACSSNSETVSNVSLWPFSGATERPVVPPNGTEYRCAAGKVFYLRYLENNAAAWVILADRELRLDKDGARFTNGTTVLTVEGDTLALNDGPGNLYSACKAAAGGKPGA